MTDATRAAAAPIPARIGAWPGRVRPLRWRPHRIGLHAAALALLLAVLFPFAWMVQMALRPADAVLDDAVLFLPTLENFVALWQGHFPKSFLNSVLVSSLSTAASLVLGVPAAYVLTRWRFRARRRVALWILATRMAPPIALTIPFFLAYRWVGLQDSVVGLALIYSIRHRLPT